MNLKFRLRPFLIWGSIILVAGFVGYRVLAPKTPKISYETVKASRETLLQTVEASGAVISMGDIELKFESAGRITRLLRGVGDDVKAGDSLAAIDDRDARLNVARASASLQSAKAGLEKLLAGSRVEDVRIAEIAVDNAESALVSARRSLTDAEASGAASLAKAYADLSASLESLNIKAASTNLALAADVFDASGNLKTDFAIPDGNAGSRAVSGYQRAKTAQIQLNALITQLRGTVDHGGFDALAQSIIIQARLVRDGAQDASAAMQLAVVAGSTTQTALDLKKTNVKNAWSDMSAAVTASESQVASLGSVVAQNASSLSAADQAVRSAEGALESARAALDLKKAPPTPADIAAQRAQVEQMNAALLEAQLALDKTVLRAPFDGKISQVNARIGRTVTAADVIMKLAGENVFEIEADVPETDVAKISVGMKGTATLDAYGSDHDFNVELTSIDTKETVIQDIVYYKTRFRLVDPDAPVRTGMTAAIAAKAVERLDVIVVPQRAIRQNGGGQKYLRLLEGGAEVRRDVTVGILGDEGKIEIISGLSGGEEVILTVKENGKTKQE